MRSQNVAYGFHNISKPTESDPNRIIKEGSKDEESFIKKDHNYIPGSRGGKRRWEVWFMYFCLSIHNLLDWYLNHRIYILNDIWLPSNPKLLSSKPPSRNSNRISSKSTATNQLSSRNVKETINSNCLFSNRLSYRKGQFVKRKAKWREAKTICQLISLRQTCIFRLNTVKR